MLNIDPDELRQRAIFQPYAFTKVSSAMAAKRRFVHYTSAEVASSIIQNSSVWMRKSSVMNDFAEIEHGFGCLRSVYGDEHGKAFKALIDGIFPGIKGELEKLVDGWLPVWREDAFITCFSEHEDDEDEHGRLSMWRAYGAPTGVALIMNPDVFYSATDALAAYTSPVAYLSEPEFKVEFDRVTEQISQNSDWLKSRGRGRFIAHLFFMFKYAIFCTKHPGFSEEREWRVIYVPKEEESKRITSSVKVVNGVPQVVCEIPLEDAPDEKLVGASIPKLLNRLIVGPSDYAHETASTLIKLLGEAGIENPTSMVRVSGIPLRTA